MDVSSLGLGVGLGFGVELAVWNQLEVSDTRERRWQYLGVYRSLLKLPRNILIEALEAIQFRRQWKGPCTFAEASTNFLRSKSTSTNFDGNFRRRN